MSSRKELKEAYKNQKPIMGVFQIKNIQNGKVLIDESTDVQAKWNRHKTELKFGSHRNTKLQQDWNDSEVENFGFEILSELEQKEEENLDYKKELKVLKDMILEELGLGEEMRY